MKRIVDFVKGEAVLAAACVLAAASAFFVPPDKEYLGYIDFRTICVLFCLMAVVGGLRGLGVFRVLAERLLKKVGTVRLLALLLVLLCFFFSMLITNDVALITFVPFTFVLLELAGEDAENGWLIPVVVMQTIAANLGSMLTPLGNPQNLYLYGISGMPLGGFMLIMLPYCALSLVLLTVWVSVRSRKSNPHITVTFPEPAKIGDKRLLVMYAALFAVSLLAVLRVIHYAAAFAAVLIAVAAADRKTLKSVDYSLLATFAGFFVFIGNMGRIPAFSGFLESVVSGSETLTAVLSSQIISNVPAALLLSGFTDNYEGLITGANLGGLGTLIASMASLISYKLFAQRKPALKGRYILCFTAANLLFLAALLGEYFVLCGAA